ncbi:MAG TPA: S41 family peptidase [Tenuifilaceae bacterium]|nr:S41 family peptidase [Tenuifilaceae bacterium]HPE17356.1 S41 family peptidase [Tenuifilaceae bacterium]HPJ45822.1 S41 family peptidase [Tenuifilaceae bacterium]HPQ33538.1 S41 family peptidase [Tenuifilaceae bacterium]HRX66830.1 S41 family peptidase [Tenuifilaceae bacterium]
MKYLIKKTAAKASFILLFVVVTATVANAQLNSNLSIYKIVRFLQYVSADYVDTVNVDNLVDEAIIDLLGNLDPHSVYISKEDVKAMNEPLEGNFEGIGIEFNIMNDTLMVVNPIPGGPSERVGIFAGDRILEIDQKNVAGIGLKNSDVFKLLRGDKGTKVYITVQRKGISNTMDFEITRDKIPIFSLDAAYMIDSKIGYIKLNRFALTTEEEFLNAIDSLKKQNMKDLILDLRGNGGGYLNAAVSLSDHFLESDKIIVYTEGRTSPRNDFMSTSNGVFEKGKLVVLIDEGSASASEILAGAIQDWDRGIVVGRRSFGKGLVQNQMPLPDGSMIRLTVARYHTPTGRVIQKPYENGDAKDYYRDFTNRMENGELFNADSINFPDSLKYYTLNKGKLVYGGGGIMPDFFVPFDTTFYSEYYGLLVRRDVLNQFVHKYVDTNRKKLLKSYQNFNQYFSNFVVDDKMVNDIVAFGEEKKVTLDEEGLNTSREEIKKQIKALIARNIFTNGEYYQVVNTDNEAILKAIEVIKQWPEYKYLVLD